LKLKNFLRAAIKLDPRTLINKEEENRARVRRKKGEKKGRNGGNGEGKWN